MSACGRTASRLPSCFQNSIQTNCSTSSGTQKAPISARSTRDRTRPPVAKVSTSATKAIVHTSESRNAAVCAAGESSCVSSGPRNSAKPVAVMSWPARLSGRRCQATRPQTANEPPVMRLRTSTPTTGSPLRKMTGTSAPNSAAAAAAQSTAQNATPRRRASKRPITWPPGRRDGLITRWLATSSNSVRRISIRPPMRASRPASAQRSARCGLERESSPIARALPEAARSAGGRGPGAEDLAQRVEHLLLVLAHALGVEPEEAALLRRESGALGGRPEQLAELIALLRGRLLPQQRVDGAQLVEDLLARARALGPEAGHRVLALLGLRGDVLGDGLRELPMGSALRGLDEGPDCGAGLLDRLDRAAGIGERDRHRGARGRPPQPFPLLLGEVGLRRHGSTVTDRLLGEVARAAERGRGPLTRAML